MFKIDGKYIEKPRLVFYGIGLLLMHGSYSALVDTSQTQLTSLLYPLNWFIFLSGIMLSQITWTKKFRNVFIPKIQDLVSIYKEMMTILWF